MKTVILSPYELDASGVVHHYISGDCLEIRYSLNFKDRDRVATLWALSSKKPYNCPCKIDIPLVKNGRAEGVRTISQKALGAKGYCLSDVDTYALVCTSPIGLCVASLGYGSLGWNITYSIGRILGEKDDEVLMKCRNKLEGIRITPKSNTVYKAITEGLEDAKNRLRKAMAKPMGEYEWYNYDSTLFPFGIGIYEHLTSTREFKKAYHFTRVCFLGQKDICHTALAMKCSHNPFVNAEDATIYVDGYWIVGVALLPEGQFFEKPYKQKQRLLN